MRLGCFFHSVKQSCTCYCEAALQYAVSHHQRLCYRTTCSQFSFVWLKLQMKQQVTICLQESIRCTCWYVSASTTDPIFTAAQIYRLHRGCYLYHCWIKKFVCISQLSWAFPVAFQLLVQCNSQQKSMHPESEVQPETSAETLLVSYPSEFQYAHWLLLLSLQVQSSYITSMTSALSW